MNKIYRKLILLFIILSFGKCSAPTRFDPLLVDPPLARGCPNTDYPDWRISPYVLPYPVGKAYQIGLSNCSGSYHSEGKPDEFAIDFNMDIGTLITASRSGTVIYVEESGIDGHFHPNNLIVVDQGDSTFAHYMHLTKNGALVEVGDHVKKGDIIGLSGNTGFAGYPHLHFVVTKNSWKWPYKSIPVTFKNTIANSRSLASDYVYKAFAY